MYEQSMGTGLCFTIRLTRRVAATQAENNCCEDCPHHESMVARPQREASQAACESQRRALTSHVTLSVHAVAWHEAQTAAVQTALQLSNARSHCGLAISAAAVQKGSDGGSARAWHVRKARVAFTAETPWILHNHVSSPHGPRCSKPHDRPRKTSLVGPPVITLPTRS